MKKLRFFRDVLAQRWGTALQRIPLDPGFACPHSGCTFCASNGSRARHLTEGMTIAEQVARGKQYVHDRYGSDGPYIAYFQAFTGTNAPVEQIRAVYEEALRLADFKMVIIGTRPDCLPEECLDYLEELNQRYNLLIELGVQTANDVTLRRINRGHDFACSAEAARRLHARDIPVAAHLILGLPGEMASDWEETARKIAELPFCGVKMHQLMIIKGTRLAAEYAAAPFPVLNEYEYAEGLEKVLRILPDSMTVMRLTAETEEEGLIAPKWWMKKGQFLEMFRQVFRERSEGNADGIHAVRTEDGSYTLYHPEYRQHFHSVAGARMESWKKYIEPCRIEERLKTGDDVAILDIGFGMGYNVAALAELAERTAKGRIRAVSLEMDRNTLRNALLLPDFPRKDVLEALSAGNCYQSTYAEIAIAWGDARQYVLNTQEKFDFLFLDAFSPDKNPELWTFEFIASLKRLLNPGGCLATYSSAYPFLGALHLNGFHIFESAPFGRKRGGTVASPSLLEHLPPLREKEFLIATKSTAGTPYHDPAHTWTRREILEDHARRVAECRASGIPKWYKG